MSPHRRVLLYVSVSAVAAIPALAQSPPASGKPVGTIGIDSVPDFSGTWQHPAFPWFEPPASGPGPITNLSRWSEQTTDGAGGSPGLPASTTGISDYDQLVGDYKNPILQPWAAEIVKKFGELSRAGITFPNPSNQCWPYPMPFTYKWTTVLVLPGKDKITLH